MARLASLEHGKEDLRLRLFMELRPPSDNLELSKLARGREKDDEDSEGKEKSLKLGEFKIVPVTTTVIDGIGAVSGVHYGTLAYIVTPTGVATEKRAVWGGNTSGVMTFNE